jgi:type VI secretion system protein ImpK
VFGRSDRRPPPARRSGAASSAERGRRSVTETVVVEVGSRRGSSAVSATPHERLIDNAAEWFGLVLALRAAGKLGDPAALRTRVLDLKTRFEAAASGFAAPDTEAAAYALIAFTDETVLSTQGAAVQVWQTRPLQLELYGRTVAGREFFERLERLRRDREARIEALEVYHACLALGFAGQYSLSGPEKIQGLLDETWRDIAAVRRGGHGALSPHGIRKTDAEASAAAGIPLWLSLGAFVVGVTLAWVVVFLLARHGAAGTAGAIHGLLGH